MNWIEGEFVSLDFETTGPDPLTARVVEVGLVRVDKNDNVRHLFHSVVNPGVPIPLEASLIHGIIDENVKGQMETKEMVESVRKIIYDNCRSGTPLVIFNVPFDWKLLLVESERIGFKCPFIPLFLDPLCLDKWLNKYRKGKRTLDRLCKAYNVEVDGKSHGAIVDAVSSVKVLNKMIRLNNILSKCDLDELQIIQSNAHLEWRTHINNYWNQNNINRKVTNGWPI